MVYYEIQVAPGHPNDLPNVARIALAKDEISVIPEVRLLKVELFEEPVSRNGVINSIFREEIYPEGGYSVEPAYWQAKNQVNITEIKQGNHLRLIFENNLGSELDVAYIVAPLDTNTYVGANDEPLEVEIYLTADESFTTSTRDPDDPENLKNTKNDMNLNIDNPFGQREKEGGHNFSSPDGGKMS